MDAERQLVYSVYLRYIDALIWPPEKWNSRGGRMPMIGGEHAAETAPFSRAAAEEGKGYDLGWVADWLYGDAALPPEPLPPREPLPQPRRWLPSAPGAPAYVRRPSTPPRETRPARQLALL
jgi:hypothetical protein